MSFRKLVVWLEDRKIRHYQKENRQELRNIQSEDWDKAFKEYLDALVCSVEHHSRQSIVDWLLGYAVRLEYNDQIEAYSEETAAAKMKKKMENAPKVASTNPLDNMDFQHKDFVKGVYTLADLLKVPHHPDHLLVLKACSLLVQERLSPNNIANPSNVIPQGQPFPIQEADLGFDTGDYILNQAAKILRLLYVHDIRNLQTRIN
jgi:RLL motif-containing protein 1